MQNFGQIMPRECEAVSIIRHSGMVRRTRPGISRFRVRVFDAPRNDSLRHRNDGTRRNRSTRTRPLRRRIHRIERLARGHEQAVALGAAEMQNSGQIMPRECEVVSIHLSSRRTPGPIRRGGDHLARWSTTLLQQLTFVVMGPGVRRDDKLMERLNPHSAPPSPSCRTSVSAPESRTRCRR